MDMNGVVGSIEAVNSAAKEAIGKAVGESKFQSDGEADNSVRRIQNYAGGLKDAVRDADAMRSAGLLVASPIRRDAELRAPLFSKGCSRPLSYIKVREKHIDLRLRDGFRCTGWQVAETDQAVAAIAAGAPATFAGDVDDVAWVVGESE